MFESEECDSSYQGAHTDFRNSRTDAAKNKGERKKKKKKRKTKCSSVPWPIGLGGGGGA